MDNIDYLKELSDKEIPEDILLLLSFSVSEDNYLKILYDYRIYGETFDKLFKLCKYEDDRLMCTLSLIKNSDMSFEVVHINLNFESPIPFVSERKDFDKPNIIQDFYDTFTFYKRYHERIDELTNKHKTIFPR